MKLLNPFEGWKRAADPSEGVLVSSDVRRLQQMLFQSSVIRKELSLKDFASCDPDL